MGNLTPTRHRILDEATLSSQWSDDSTCSPSSVKTPPMPFPSSPGSSIPGPFCSDAGGGHSVDLASLPLGGSLLASQPLPSFTYSLIRGSLRNGLRKRCGREKL